MKVSINIDKVTALRAGKDRYGRINVDVAAESLTTAQREELAKHERGAASMGAEFYIHDEHCKDISEAIADSVRAILDRLIAEAAEREAKEAQRKAEEIAENATAIKTLLDQGLRSRDDNDRVNPEKYVATHYFGGNNWQTTGLVDKLAKMDARVEALREAAQIECERLNQEMRAEEERRKEAVAAKKLAGIQGLRFWAEANGSELLRARIAEGFEWVGLAEVKWSQAIVACLGETAPEGGTAKDRTTPTLEEIAELKRVRGLLGDRATASLLWVTHAVESEDEYGGGVVTQEKVTEIEVEVECPTGRLIDYYFPVRAKQTA